MPARKTSNSGQLSRYEFHWKQKLLRTSSYHEKYSGARLGRGDHLQWVHQPRCSYRGGQQPIQIIQYHQIYFHFRFGKSHIVSQMVSNGTPCSWMILWCSKRWNIPNKNQPKVIMLFRFTSCSMRITWRTMTTCSDLTTGGFANLLLSLIS